MTSNFIGMNKASFNSSGQRSYDLGIPGYFNSYEESRLNFFDWMDCKPDTSSLDRSFLDLYDDSIDPFRDDHIKYKREELSEIDKVVMLEQLTHEQQEIHRMINKLKDELYCVKDYTFLEKLMVKQQTLSRSLNNYEGIRVSRLMNQQTRKDDFIRSEPQAKTEEKDRGNEMFSTEQFPEQASSIKSQTQSDSSKISKPQSQVLKSKHCRHFLKGHCVRGNSCGFRHDQSVFCTDLQKVFLGGLPAHLTSSMLKKNLMEQGYTVLNNPKILRWFSPQVCLGSVEEAQRLIKQKAIVIGKTVAQVRPFQTFAQDNEKKQPDEVERSVFLGGLSTDTTTEMIRDELRKLGLIVLNIPILKSGYSPQVVLETYHQARKLVQLGRVRINGALVNVRPFANIRSSSGKKKKRTKAPAIQI